MTEIVPASRPEMDITEATTLLAAYGVKAPAIIGIRGYFESGDNKRGIFDDAIAILTPRTYRTFNGNTDPSSPDTDTRLATLAPGVWDFKLGLHHPGTPKEYPCLVQAGPVTVLRDNGVKETGEFYIHIHHGGLNTTTSEGCQTIYLPQWPEFFQLVKAEMQFYNIARIPYVLTVREDA